MLSKIHTATIRGIEGMPITIETDLANGMPVLSVVGLADTIVKEAKERIRTAINNTGLEYPKGRITMNMSPAGIRKRGSHFDLAMSVGILASSRQLFDRDLSEYGFLGELSLDGTICKCSGVLPMVMALKKQGIRHIIVPKGNCTEAALVEDVEILPAENLEQVVEHFNLQRSLQPYIKQEFHRVDGTTSSILDFSDVRGQEAVKQAIVIAVAGGHGILMVGSPATGKTMISERIPSIMPAMSREEIIETTIIYSVAGLLSEDQPYISQRPFRQPHHRITQAGMLGGGAFPMPGEITLANKGVLFLDEVGEFDRNLIDTLRIPLEKKKMTMIRRGESYVFPADFLLVAATNPCKCGYYGDPEHSCTCSSFDVARYQSHLSGPILDRIDMHIRLQAVCYGALNTKQAKSSAEMKASIEAARSLQKKRYANTKITLNSQLNNHMLDTYAPLDKEGHSFLEQAYGRFGLNPRTLTKVRKLARTIADLEGSSQVCRDHLAQALQYRERVLS